jgi:FkbM family methyltransferase
MLIQLKDILVKYGLSPKGVIHVGAHWAEEHEDYLKCGLEKFVYVEPCVLAFKKMVESMTGRNWPDEFTNGDVVNYANCHFFMVACGSTDGVKPMYVSADNQGQSNSLLEPKLHLEQHPEVKFTDAEAVKVVALDSLPIQKENYDFLVMDVQGYEGEVLKGGVGTLKHIKIIYTEVNRGQTYAGNMEIEEMDELLKGHGFERVETYWPSPNWTWGDAVYIKK